MRSIWKKYKEYIIILAYLGILFVLFYLVIKPMIKRIDYAANLIQEKIVEQENYKKKLSMIPKNREQLDAIKEDEEKLGVLLSGDEKVMLIEKIEKIADDTGNKITIEAQDNIASGAVKSPSVAKKTSDKENKEEIKINPDNIHYVKLKITISGDYDELVNFIQKVENMGYWSDITSLQVAYKEPEKSTNAGSADNAEQSTVISETDKASSILEVIFYLRDKI